MHGRCSGGTIIILLLLSRSNTPSNILIRLRETRYQLSKYNEGIVALMLRAFSPHHLHLNFSQTVWVLGTAGVIPFVAPFVLPLVTPFE